MPNDDMGVGHALAEPEGKSITEKTFTELAKKWGKTSDEVKKLMLELLLKEKNDPDKEHEMEHIYQEAAKSQGMTVEEAQKETLKMLKKVLKEP